MQQIDISLSSHSYIFNKIESNLLLEQILLAIEARYEELEQQKSLEPDEHLSLRDLDSVARDSFPLCMRLLLHRLKV